ncbi:glutathione transferase [Aureococcus anophagefferens]|nr:glutathione transferase [Aureococcus anophagefferens]
MSSEAPREPARQRASTGRRVPSGQRRLAREYLALAAATGAHVNDARAHVFKFAHGGLSVPEVSGAGGGEDLAGVAAVVDELDARDPRGPRVPAPRARLRRGRVVVLAPQPRRRQRRGPRRRRGAPPAQLRKAQAKARSRTAKARRAAPLSEASYKLYYFDIAGKGEGIRLAFTYCGVPFEDYRFADREEFNEMKASGRLMFGQVPALESRPWGRRVAEPVSGRAALHRQAQAGGRALPDGPARRGKVDALCDQEADAFMGLRVTKYKDAGGFLGDEANAAQLAAAVEANNGEVIPRHLATLAKHVEAGGTGWLAGTAGPTIADFAWVPVLAAIADGWTGDAAALDATPALVARRDRTRIRRSRPTTAPRRAQVGETKAV